MLSISHLIIIFIVALAVLGPDKIPKMARTLGKMMADFRRVTGDFRYQVESEMREAERQTRINEELELNAQAEETAYNATMNLSQDTPAVAQEPAPGPEEPHSSEPQQPSEVSAGDPQKSHDAHRPA
jgi:sec-independent protein translocase protein TatB